MTLGIGAGQVQPHHLSKDRRPLRPVDGLSDAEGGQIFVPALADLVSLGTDEDVGQVACTEILPCAQHR